MGQMGGRTPLRRSAQETRGKDGPWVHMEKTGSGATGAFAATGPFAHTPGRFVRPFPGCAPEPGGRGVLFSSGRFEPLGRRPLWRAAFLWSGVLAVLIAAAPLILLALGRPLAFVVAPYEERAGGLPGITLDRTSEGERGLVVTSIEQPGPAARAGMAVGDRIVAVNGRRIRSQSDVRRAAHAVSSRTQEVEFLRAGRRYRIRLGGG